MIKAGYIPVEALRTSDQCYREMLMNSFGLYIHVPFCRRKCFYCDFYSIQGTLQQTDEYIDALEVEIDLVVSRLPDDYRVATLYFGGGTPSMLARDCMNRIQKVLFDRFCFVRDLEWTMEVNPESCSPDQCVFWSDFGVTRVSLGVQSLHDSFLGVLGRSHRRVEAIKAMELLAKGPFKSWSVDLMCGIPGQSERDWLKDLDMIEGYGPPHLSVYALTLEPETALFEQWKRGAVVLPDEDLVADQLVEAERRLLAIGYEHYEISSYALPGHCGRHNLAYWKRTPYIGLGPAAASFWSDVRSTGPNSLDEYVSGLTRTRKGDTTDPFGRPDRREIEVLSRAEACRESIILGTRLLDEFNLQEWLADCDDDTAADVLVQIDKHVLSGLLELSGQTLTLSPRGRWLANKVWLDFFG